MPNNNDPAGATNTDGTQNPTTTKSPKLRDSIAPDADSCRTSSTVPTGFDWQAWHLLIANTHGMRPDRVAFVAVVEVSDGKYRRRPYLSLEAAHRAVERAHGRGVAARIMLCELRPIVVDQ